MNFTLEIKKELIHSGFWKDKRAKIAGLSAFIRTCGEFGIQQETPTFFIVSQTERVAEFFMETFAKTFGCDLTVAHAAQDRLSGKDKLVIACPLVHGAYVLKELSIYQEKTSSFKEGVPMSLMKDEKSKLAYIRGAFLAGGSCTLPSDHGGGYHLEIVFRDRHTARDFCKLLSDEEVLARLVMRKDDAVVYIKSKELISDFLAVIGANNALNKFTAFVEKRDESNHDNRAQNCISGNADKTAIAAVKQVVAIQKLEKNGGLTDLNVQLKLLAKTRLKNPEKTLQELADMLGESKSCINHRMRKLMELAGEIDD